MKEKFDKKKYDIQYVKNHYKSFNVNIPKDLSFSLENKLKELGLSKAQFLRNAIEEILKK